MHTLTGARRNDEIKARSCSSWFGRDVTGEAGGGELSAKKDAELA